MLAPENGMPAQIVALGLKELEKKVWSLNKGYVHVVSFVSNHHVHQQLILENKRSDISLLWYAKIPYEFGVMVLYHSFPDHCGSG